MTDHLEVQRWLFKMNDELSGRGTAYCDVCHVSFRPWAVQEYRRHGAQIWRMAWAQVSVGHSPILQTDTLALFYT